MFFCILLIFFKVIFEKKTHSGIQSECQTFFIHIRPDVLSGLTWVQTVCKGYQQTILVGKVLTSLILVLFDELDDDESNKALFNSCIDDFKLWIWKEARLL